MKMLVGLPMQVAIVNGLKRNLQSHVSYAMLTYTHNICLAHSAATTKPLHLLSLRGELNLADEPASPDSAMAIRALALSRSTII